MLGGVIDIIHYLWWDTNEGIRRDVPISESTSLFNRYCINIISSNTQVTTTHASQTLYQESVLYSLGLGIQLTTNETVNQHFVPFLLC